jgi:DNA-binding NtrC family response regulator
MAKKVLIIDDDEAVRRVLEIHLTGSDYDVSSAKNAREGLELANSECYDLVLCDLKLPDKSGIEVIKELRTEHINLPIVVISGFIDEHIANEVRSAGAVEYISKPFLKKTILSLLSRILDVEKEAGRA